MSMIRSLSLAPVLSLAVCVLVCGCGPAVSQEELGKVEFKIPRLAGDDEPFRMPQIDGLPIKNIPPEGELKAISEP